MELSETSLLSVLLNISKAVGVEGSAINDPNLLREIFEKRDAYGDDAVVNFEIRSQFAIQNSQNLFGRDIEVEQLLSKLLGPNERGIQLSVIPILGDSGIGKTSLARKIYENLAVRKHFEVLVWVTMEGGEFNLQQAAQGILKSMIGTPCSFDDLDELDEMVTDTLHSQRCLIVFDGIESMAMDSWLYMNRHWFYSLDLGSIVLITTSNKDVVHPSINQQLILLRQLSSKDSLSFLHYRGIKNISSILAKNLSSLCCGNPLALGLVACLVGWNENLRDLFSYMYFSDFIVPSPSIPILLCIWALPLHLRQCFSYCAVFPKGYALSKEKIIDLWISHGLVKPTPGNNSLEDIGNAYFLQLLYRSIFTDIICDQHSDIIEFRIPGLIHEIGEHVARIVYKLKPGLVGFVGEDAGQLSLVSPSPGKYLSQDIQILILAPTLDLADRVILNHSLRDFHGLQSLDLSCSGISSLSDYICELKELRYVNLSYTLIEKLPDSITELSQLQTLDLSGCYHLKVLPEGMHALMHSRHLDFSRCDSLAYLPSGIGSLRSLTSLPLFVLGKGDCAHLGELEQLNQLRGRLEIRNLENVVEITEARNAKLHLKNLQHLGLVWSHNADNCVKVLDLLHPNPHLTVLNLTGYMGDRFPWWLSSSNNLIKISITDCACKKLPSLGQLPFLKELQLNRLINLNYIDQDFYGGSTANELFPSLEQLDLYDLPELLGWSVPSRLDWSGATVLNASSNSVFRSLITLTVEGCPKLPSLPPLPSLPNLILKNSGKGTIYSLFSFSSLSSLLINDMIVGRRISFVGSGRLESLKKLTLCNIRDDNISFCEQRSLTALEYLGIRHCQELAHVSLNMFPSLQKLHIVDCPNLGEILMCYEEDTQLKELVVEDCHKLANISYHKFHCLMKLILKNCHHYFSIYRAGEFKRLEKLEYLSISGCAKLESEFHTSPWLISHIPCIIVGNLKANFKDINDLREVLISASYEPESEAMVPSPDGFSGPQKSITEQAIHNVMAVNYKELVKATQNFRPDVALGEGGFGTVFKGWMHEHHLTAAGPGSGIAVAIKKLNPNGHQGHEEWLNELTYLSKIHHPNLVQLLGFCDEKDDRILVYEFMPKGSLGSHLFKNRLQSLPWATRINVAIGAARGLSFLHNLEIPVIHRNVKSATILLDNEFNAKLSGFGLAIDGPTGQATHISTQVMGTYGYAAPEYIATGHLFIKSDVYSYGVVLLELLSGRRALDSSRPVEQRMLVQWAKPYLRNKRKLVRIMDTGLEGQYPHAEANAVAKLAMQCLSEEPETRPGMAEVTHALEQLPKTKVRDDVVFNCSSCL